MQLAQTAPLDVLVMGDFDHLPSGFRSVGATDGFSAIFCDDTVSLTFEELSRLRVHAHQDLFPVYWFGANAPAFVDGKFTERNPDSFNEALKDARAKLDRLGKIGEVAKDEDRPLLNLLGFMASRKRDAVPFWAPDEKSLVAYRGLRPDIASRSLLMQLYQRGLLERDFWRRTHQCGNCQSSRLNVAEHCPECRSANLIEMDIVHHFACGHQGPQESFQLSAGGRMICPSCEQYLDHFGVDYDKPGRVEVCRNCETTSETPLTIFECLDCSSMTLSDEAVQRDWYSFKISATGQEALSLGKIPISSWENVFGGFEPSKDYATFAALLENGLSTARRYGRPFSVATMRLTGDDGEGGSPSEVSDTAARKTLVKLVREILRDSDFLYAAGEQIVFVFPETDAAELQSIMTRLDERLLADVTDPPHYTFADWSDLSLREILQGARGVR